MAQGASGDRRLSPCFFLQQLGEFTQGVTRSKPAERLCSRILLADLVDTQMRDKLIFLRGNQLMKHVFHSVVLLLAALCMSAADQPTSATMTTQKFEFVSNGNRLSGFVDLPAGGAARAMIVIIHGYDRTDVAGLTSYYDLRSRFTQSS
jgi:hypothetical protein